MTKKKTAFTVYRKTKNLAIFVALLTLFTGANLGLLCIQQLDAANCENCAKLYFDTKHKRD